MPNAIEVAKNLYSKIKGFVAPTVNQVANTVQSFTPTLNDFKNQVIRTALNTQKAISNQPLFQAPGIGFTPNIPSPTVGQGANFLKSVTLEPPARVGGSLALTAQRRSSFAPTTGFEKFLYGNNPIKSFPQQQKEASQLLQNVGVNTNASNALAAGGVLGMAALDVLPITSGKGKVAKNIAEETAQTLRKTGKNLFSNVKTIDNPLLLGKDWMKKRLENIKAIPQNFNKPEFTDEINRIQKAIEPKFQTPVTKKVNLLDYFKTPENVLNKIGLGEQAKYLRSQYDSYVAELPKEIDRISQWVKRVPTNENQALFRYLDGQANIKSLSSETQKVAIEIKNYLKGWADKLGLPEDKRIANYITHIFEPDFIAKEFDEDIAALIRDKVPGSVYDPFLQKRMGQLGYVEDTWRALDAYTKRATRKFYMDPALNKLKQASVNLEESQVDYVKNLAERINLRPTKFDNLVDNLIKLTPIGYALGQRPVANITRTARQMVYRGLLGLNPATAIKNLTQGANTYAKLGEKYTALGYLKLLKNWTSPELKQVGVLADNIVQDRTLSSTKKVLQGLDRGLFILFDTAEKINRGAAYYGAKAKALAEGKTEQQAIEFGKKIVRDTQFVFGNVDTPVALSSDLAKLATQFQSFTLKQTEFLGGMIKKKDFAGLTRWLGSSLAMVYLIGDTIGMKPTDLIPSFRVGVPPSLQLPFGIGEVAVGAPDKYGNPPDNNLLKRTLENPNIQKGIVNFIPGGGQIRKSAEAIKAMQEGASYTPSGRFRFEVKPSISTALFGIWNTKEGKEYLNKRLGVNLSEEEKQAKDINKQQTQTQIATEKVAQGIIRKLKTLETTEERKGFLDDLEQRGILPQGDNPIRRKILSLQKGEKVQSQSSFTRAVALINTNEGKAKFISVYFQKKAKTTKERRALIDELENSGILTDDLREKIAQQARQ